MTIGPSMANIVQFYGKRKAYGLSVSPNPLHRNPSYEPVYNPDAHDPQTTRSSTWSGTRSPRPARLSSRRSLLRYADRYNGRVVHTETIPVPTDDGKRDKKPLITIYEVRP